MGVGMAVASAGPYADILHLAPDNHTNTSSLDFYRPGGLHDAQPTVSKHRRHRDISRGVKFGDGSRDPNHASLRMVCHSPADTCSAVIRIRIYMYIRLRNEPANAPPPYQCLSALFDEGDLDGYWTFRRQDVSPTCVVIKVAR